MQTNSDMQNENTHHSHCTHSVYDENHYMHSYNLKLLAITTGCSYLNPQDCMLGQCVLAISVVSSNSLLQQYSV